MTQQRVSALAMSLSMIAAYATAGQAAVASDDSVRKPCSTGARQSPGLSYAIKSEYESIVAGTPFVVIGTLENKNQIPVAVSPAAMFRYINHSRTAAHDGEFGPGGQIIGDDPGIGHGSRDMTVIAPGGTVSRTLDLSASRVPIFVEPGEYRISVDYCYFGPKKSGRTIAPIGCVSSNEIVVTIVSK